jgi:hypothetical protein
MPDNSTGDKETLPPGNPAAPSEREAHTELKRWRTNPLALLALTMLSIFSSEVAVMVVLGLFPNISRYALPLLDAALLTLLVFPFLYLLFFRPMTLYIAECNHYRKDRERLATKPREKP